jgi:hypothetical protein
LIPTYSRESLLINSIALYSFHLSPDLRIDRHVATTA